MTSGCRETVTDGMVAGLAITLFPDDSVLWLAAAAAAAAAVPLLLLLAGAFDVDGVVFVAELLVDASPMLLSLSTSIFSFVAVTGIITIALFSYVSPPPFAIKSLFLFVAQRKIHLK